MHPVNHVQNPKKKKKWFCINCKHSRLGVDRVKNQHLWQAAQSVCASGSYPSHSIWRCRQRLATIVVLAPGEPIEKILQLMFSCSNWYPRLQIQTTRQARVRRELDHFIFKIQSGYLPVTPPKRKRYFPFSATWADIFVRVPVWKTQGYGSSMMYGNSFLTHQSAPSLGSTEGRKNTTKYTEGYIPYIARTECLVQLSV